MRARVLVVDDLQDVQSTIKGILEDDGFLVETASSQAEALQIIQTYRFHVVVTDVRLDDPDEGNRDGLQLMHKINKLDSTIAIIILTGFADVAMVQEALQPDAKGQHPAFGFLQKTEITRLPEQVRLALRNHVGIAEDMPIDDPDAALSQIASGLRFRNAKPSTQAELLEELREILAKLFLDCEIIKINMISQGFSGAGVLEIQPCYRARGSGEKLIAKIGELSLIEKEVHNYSAHVNGMIGGHRLPTAISVARTRSLGGVIYTYAGLGQIQDFRSFCQQAGSLDISYTLENLYLKTCALWAKQTARCVQDYDLKSAYSTHLNLNPKNMGLIKERMTGGKHIFQNNPEKGEIIFDGRIRLVDPIAFIACADLRCDSQVSTIHGDLYSNNILVDEHKETWLIDFEKTGDGPSIQDYASLDNHVRLFFYESDDMDLWMEWERNLLSDPGPVSFTRNEALEKNHLLVNKIRELAGQVPQFSEFAYMVGLLYNALKTATLLRLPTGIRNHAFLSACLIAGQISNGMEKG